MDVNSRVSTGKRNTWIYDLCVGGLGWSHSRTNPDIIKKKSLLTAHRWVEAGGRLAQRPTAL